MIKQGQVIKKGWIREKHDNVFDTVVYVLSTLIVLITLYPLIFVVSASVSDPSEVLLGNVIFLPKKFSILGYTRILGEKDVWIGYRNSIFYTVGHVSLVLFTTLPAAFAISRKDMVGRGVLLFILGMTMFIGGGLIPTYITIRKLGMLDTVWVLLLMGAFNTGHCLIARTYFSTTIPYELQEAAKIDGASEISLFVRIMLPLSGPLIAVLSLFNASGIWNEYFNAQIYLTRDSIMPLQVFLRRYLLTNEMVNEALKNADADAAEAILKEFAIRQSMRYGLIVISSVPLLIVYPFFQRYFVKGMLVGSLKG